MTKTARTGRFGANRKIATLTLPRMGTVWTIIIGIHLCSLLFLSAYHKRLFKHVSRYKMVESKYTLLFGWIQLTHVVIAYGVSVAFFVVMTTVYLLFSV